MSQEYVHETSTYFNYFENCKQKRLLKRAPYLKGDLNKQKAAKIVQYSKQYNID